MFNIYVGIKIKMRIKFLFKSCLFLLFMCLIFVCSFTYGYEHGWFLEYDEWGKWISFRCEDKCYISLWKVEKSDYLNINWTIDGTGHVVIFSEWKNLKDFLYIGSLSSVSGSDIIFSNYDKILLDHLQDDVSLWIEFRWSVWWALKVDKLSFNILQKSLKVLKEFWKMETFNYGGMNFRNWVSMWWHNIVEYGYILFILAVISILIISLVFRKLKKEKIFKLIFYVWLCMFLFIWFRNIITWTVLLKQWLSWFTDNYNLFQLKDYIWFVVKVRNKLHLDDFEKNDCKIFIKSDKLLYNWAVDLHWEYFFEPCERVYSSDLADYVLYAGVEIEAEDYGKDVLVEYNGRYLLDNRMK